MSVEWDEPAIVLETAPYGEGDALIMLLTAGQGTWKGLVRGGNGRGKTALWQPGNLITAGWSARLPEQLGHFTGEMVHPAAALAMDDRLNLAILNAACALAAGSLPEREAAPDIFAGLARLLAGINIPGMALPALVRWELDLLRELGFGLDFSARAVAGDNDQLAYVSPKTGRALSISAAGDWAPRLLKLPAFLLDDVRVTEEDCADGLKLTGHFLARDVFGSRHKPLPPARERLYDLLLERLQDS
ncbi:MAG: DNA repair protein RecO [Acidocella sp. 20-57-95]|nr:MAG: DNA repair protein RecO [Acidocella sp. 20-57-95]OYV59710.1 MAG: DNA repair protein RecO [Acidocella sp. 21-58-7]HQT64722.1 DNA repair protein RecO [Acidocella sp.]HQU03512.1 DNA repair protein RecO [Acidocella sp.]